MMFARRYAFVATAIATVIGGSGSAVAGTELPLFSFSGGKDGQYPQERLLVMPSGVSYGVTTTGGFKIGYGQVIRTEPPNAKHSDWLKRPIYRFSTVPDGYAPRGALATGPNGSIFGTTQLGGTSSDPACAPATYGCGTLFQLFPPVAPGTPWTKVIRYSFNSADGTEPRGLIIDSAGNNLYGTTRTTVFRMPTYDNGVYPPWQPQVLHTFSGIDGTSVNPDLLLASDGTIFGTTPDGGASGQGTVFSLAPRYKGPFIFWTYSHVYDFGGVAYDATVPNGGLVADASGNIFGTSRTGGKGSLCSCGTVFELQPVAGAPYSFSIIHYFGNNPDVYTEGANPVAGLYRTKDGRLWGTNSLAAEFNSSCPDAGCGTVFYLTPTLWKYIVYIYPLTLAATFEGKDFGDGSYPDTALAADHLGRLYGGTLAGGTSGDFGTIFQVTP